MDALEQILRRHALFEEEQRTEDAGFLSPASTMTIQPLSSQTEVLPALSRHNTISACTAKEREATAAFASTPLVAARQIATASTTATTHTTQRDGAVSSCTKKKSTLVSSTPPLPPSVSSYNGCTLDDATPRYSMPHSPYSVQNEMMHTITQVLESRAPHAVPVVATEVPTGCGKTLALLSCVLMFQEKLKRMTPKEVESYTAERDHWGSLSRRQKQPRQQQQWKKNQGAATGGERRKSTRDDEKENAAPQDNASSAEASTTRVRFGETLMSNVNANTMPTARGEGTASVHQPCVCQGGGAGAEEEGDSWTPPHIFFKQFRVAPNKRLRIEVDPTGSSELRRQFVPPPCTIFYATRTHAQIRQAVHELRKLKGAGERVRVNILGSRDRYCINPICGKGKTSGTLPVQGNNLGEVCDKLVTLGQCEAVEKYGELACKAIGGPIAGRRDQIWDLEDLVSEGTAHHACPYYAARDLAFYADINFCSYNYLLDPLVRSECKMEGAVRNRSIVIFDEAHNVADVCQDALSMEGTCAVLQLVQREIAPLCGDTPSSISLFPGRDQAAAPMATLSYPRDFKLTDYTLAELLAFLLRAFHAIERFFLNLPDTAVDDDDDGKVSSREETASSSGTGVALAYALRAAMQEGHRFLWASRNSKTRTIAAQDGGWEKMFQQVYGIIMCLGVTFNPFQFSVFSLSIMKRWLLIIRFLLQKPSAFALRASRSSGGGDGGDAAYKQAILEAMERLPSLPGIPSEYQGSTRWYEVRCLDGSLAFHHLLRSTYRVVLASGTLLPFSQLAKDLALTPAMLRQFEGQHVVGSSQYLLSALTHLPRSGIPLHCTHASLSSGNHYSSSSSGGGNQFVRELAHVIVQLARAVPVGGVLVFAPNYAVVHALAAHAVNLTRGGGDGGGDNCISAASMADAPPQLPLTVLEEPRHAVELTPLLQRFRSLTKCSQQQQRGPTLLFCVYRGKVSEGIDFTDEMARLVLCVGVPLQPFRSWRVRMQRQYSGPQWYITDALRAVNQALGRCLRHAQDYGAVVLLDDRYAHGAQHAGLLSRWCREALTPERDGAALAEKLSCFYRRCGAERSTTLQQQQQLLREMPSYEDGETGRDFGHHHEGAGLFTTVMGRQRGRCNDAGGGGAIVSATRLPAAYVSQERDRTRVVASKKASSGATAHTWRETAIKLLYEEHADTSDVTREHFAEAVAALQEMFDDDPSVTDEERSSEQQ